MIQIKRYNDGQDGVGEWHYELIDQGLLQYDSPTLHACLDHIARVAGILKEEGFFQFSHLRVERWCRIDHTNGAQDTVVKPTNISAQKILEAKDGQLQDLFSPEQEQDFWFPLFAVMEGITKIDFGNHLQEIARVVSVRVTLAGFLAFTLVVDCDAYLPYDLLGREQTTLAQLNAPKLAAAISNLTITFKMQPSLENTRYAIITETGMESKWEDEGEPHITDVPQTWIEKEWT
jgi:hypothetical protein